MKVKTSVGIFTMEQAEEIYEEYEICCTHEFLQEQYENPDDELRNVAEETRRLMFKYDICEADAIQEAADNLEIKLISKGE